MVKPGAPTVKLTVVKALIDPAVPVTVTVYVPGAAELLARKVNWLKLAVGFVANDAVTPAGSPEADSVMAPVKPY
jgi:hypothetical protein